MLWFKHDDYKNKLDHFYGKYKYKIILINMKCVWGVNIYQIKYLGNRLTKYELYAYAV